MTNPTDSMPSSDPKRELLRHTLATLAYRGGKAVRNAPVEFADFHAGEGVRTPGQILAHMGDLFDWALSIAMGQQKWHDSRPLPWEREVERFFAALKNEKQKRELGETRGREPARPSLTHSFDLEAVRAG